MRKWQRDRQRRRTRKPQTPGQKAAQPEPLQPLYPDMDRRLEAPAPPPEPEPHPREAGEDISAEAAPPQAGRGNRRGRRGRRGGRGRPRTQGTKPAVEPVIEPSAEPAASEIAPDLPAATAPTEPRPPQPAHRAPRTPKGVVVLAIGLPGSGKSSWFKRRGVTPLSSDLLRTILFDDITEQRYQDLVFGTLRALLRARMVARMPWNYVDATNLSPRERHGWIKMARDFGYEVHAVYFDVPLEVCLERNHRRSRIVPEDVMQRMAQKLRAPTFEEGFAKITVVRVKKKEEGGETEAAE
ncbi:MAG: AAA family ATPase [Terriglobales bacterium]